MTTDPFDSLREPAAPLAPDASFAADLRRRLADRLGVDDPERTPMTDAPTTHRAPSHQDVRAYTPARSHSLTPYLSVPRAAEALDWYAAVFDAVLIDPPIVMDDGRVGHAELRVGDTVFGIADEFPEMDLTGPTDTNSVSLMLYVPDVDDTLARAAARGADVQRPAEEAYGARRAVIRDPFGHRWMLGTATSPDDVPVEDVPGRRFGDIGYVTLQVPDGERARRFFEQLFGWDVHAGSVPGGFHIASITPPAGIATSPGSEPGPLVYFRVDDLEAAAARVRELGGEVLSVTDHPSGGNAECRDDQGLRFDLFRPRPGY